jgi:hypothetical protein
MRDQLSTTPIERIRGHLVSLRMPRALEALDQVVQQLERGQATAIEAIETLCVSAWKKGSDSILVQSRGIVGGPLLEDRRRELWFVACTLWTCHRAARR